MAVVEDGSIPPSRGRQRRTRPPPAPTTRRRALNAGSRPPLVVAAVVTVAAAASSLVLADATESSMSAAGEGSRAEATAVAPTAPVNATLAATPDLAEVYYRYYNATQILPPLTLGPAVRPPLPVRARLRDYGLAFDDLDGSLQRALLWDSGYAVYADPSGGATNATFAKIYTRDGVAMSDISLARDEIEGAGCAIQACTSPEAGSVWRSVSCRGDDLLRRVRCAIDPQTAAGSVPSVPISDRQRSVWSIRNTEVPLVDARNRDVGLQLPTVNIARHWWPHGNADANAGDPPSDTPVVFYAIHTMPFADEPPVGQCPSLTTPDGSALMPALTIPCAVFPTLTDKRAWQRPRASPRVNDWLRATAKTAPVKTPAPNGQIDRLPSASTPSTPGRTSSNDFNLWNLVPIFVGALALVAIGIGFVMFRRRRQSQNEPTDGARAFKTVDPAGDDGSYIEGAAFLSPATSLRPFPGLSDPSDFASTTASTTADLDGSSRRRSVPKSLPPVTSLRRVTSEPPLGHGPNRPSLDAEHVRLLQTDPNLSACRVSYDKMVFERILSRSTRYEIWLCQYEGDEIAVKRLASDLEGEGNNMNLDEGQTEGQSSHVESFIEEIRVTAALEHPNLARFVGVAWSRIPAESLCLIMEYQSNGDLRRYLQKHRDDITWRKEKISWAQGIARGMSYLHGRSPPVLHMELNSIHVLLSDRLEPRLIDFGERPGADDWMRLRLSGDRTQLQRLVFPYWAAPEVLRGEQHRTASDVYSFGMLMVELDTCKVPYQDAKNSSDGQRLKPFQMLNKVIAGRLRPMLSDNCPPGINDIAQQCIHQDASKRPSMAEVVRQLQIAQYELAA